MARPTFVLCRQPSCKAYRFFAAPHDAPCGRCAGPHDASCDRCAAPHPARCDLCAALDAAPYRTMLEQTALELMVLERMVVPEPRHLTWLARWSALPSQTRRLVREESRDARSFFHSCLISRDFEPPPRGHLLG